MGLKRRKGFVKMAIRTGADLVPVLAFGENDLYDQLQPDSHPKIHKFQLLVKKLLGFTIPLSHARGIFNYDVGLMPYRRPLNIVVGRPIRVMQSSQPGQEEIDRVHEEYIQELETIWHTWKDTFGNVPNLYNQTDIGQSRMDFWEWLHDRWQRSLGGGFGSWVGGKIARERHLYITGSRSPGILPVMNQS